MPHQKPNLPQKPCAGCGRPFAWRRKWARVWDEVRFCSRPAAMGGIPPPRRWHGKKRSGCGNGTSAS
ncbi:DUF2256 domain-containing protein [Teichococcus aestuarii]|uniref:DUF2256 domain-containing protein n=1 Tax=Teichococcus aestuarii TaxID=568898 RepID=UPI00361C3492